MLATTRSVSVQRPPAEVDAFVADHEAAGWIAGSPQGPVRPCGVVQADLERLKRALEDEA